MKIFAHRGLWSENAPPNSNSAHSEAALAGFGTEIDLRDCQGEIVVCHDLPRGPETHYSLRTLLRTLPEKAELALNLKSAGLLPGLQDQLLARLSPYFLFDLPGPEMWAAQKLGLPYFVRLSPYERAEDFARHALGCVVDSFSDQEFSRSLPKIVPALEFENLFFISDEIHGLDPLSQWHALRDLEISARHTRFMLCTDRPRQAREFFDGN